jgi:hypothetical protein
MLIGVFLIYSIHVYICALYFIVTRMHSLTFRTKNHTCILPRKKELNNTILYGVYKSDIRAAT